jgi:hypothetical protein
LDLDPVKAASTVMTVKTACSWVRPLRRLLAVFHKSILKLRSLLDFSAQSDAERKQLSMGSGDLDVLQPEGAIRIRPHESSEVMAKLLCVASVNGVAREVCYDRYGLTLHMFRRGFATLAHANCGTLRDIQEQLRHASAATTANVYVQAVPESVRETVEKMDRALRKKAKAAKEKV